MDQSLNLDAGRSAPRRRARRNAASPSSGSEDIAATLQAGFRAAAADAIRRAHSVGLPVPILDAADQLAWLHPDGTVGPTSDKP
jgi:hypothetical protein